MNNANIINPALYPSDVIYDESAPAYQKLAVWINKFQTDPDDVETLQALGLAKTDKIAQETFRTLISEFSQHCTVERVGGNPTVYYLKNKNNEPRAVFKLGEKKAAMEVLARKAAHLLSLESHIPPSMYFAMQNLDVNPILMPKISESPYSDTSRFSTEEEEGEASRTLLWDGSAAVYLQQPLSEQEETEFRSAVFGVLQPYIPTTEMSQPDLARLVLTCLALLIRDVNQLGIIGAVSIDNEYSFTADSKEPNLPAITDLPFLDAYTEELDIPMRKGELQQIVASWNVKNIIKILSKEPLQYFDSHLNHTEEEAPVSEGYLETALEGTKEEPYVLNVDYLDEEINPDSTVLLKEQIATLQARLQALKTFFARTSELFTIKDLIFAIDPQAHLYYEASKLKNHVFSIIGRNPSPLETRSSSMGCTDSSGPPPSPFFVPQPFCAATTTQHMLKPIPLRTPPPQESLPPV